jgi:hypothetical protein
MKMKIRKLFSFFAAVTLALTTIILPATPVAAAGAISTSLTTGPIGSSITVSGSGFGLGDQTYVWFDTTAFGPYPAAGGSMSATIQVPKVPRTGSAYQIHVQDVETPLNNSNYVYFTITPQIGVGATTASVGDSVTIYGNGFYASYSVAIYFDNAIVGTVNTDANGAFDGASFVVPPAYHGSHAVKCRDTTDTQPINLSVDSKLTANPSSGGSGDKTSLTGTGFAVNSPVTFYWDESVVSGASTTTDLNGGFTFPNFNIPTSAKGNHTIKAIDVNSNLANAVFSSAQKISVSPASGVSGAQITVQGNGFDGGKTVTIKYGPNAISPTTGAVTTDSSGGFSATFPVPAGATGNYTIEAYDGSNLAQSTFSQLAEIKVNAETTAAKPGHVGQEVTITGDGLRPNVTVNIYFASDSTLIGTPTTDGNGHFSTSVKIPASAAGNHTITVTDNLTIKAFPFYIETLAPLAPKLITPKDKDKLDEGGNFNWEAVTDPSGVAYTLQITTDQNFNAVIVEKKGLTQPSYTLSAVEKLPSNNSNNPYYWRVKATDGTSLDSPWSEAQTFNVGFVLELSPWMYGLLIGLGGILLFLMGFLLGRRVALR